MIRIHDNRNTNERKLKDIDINGYFMLDGCLCRRVSLSSDYKYDTDEYPILEVAIGHLSFLGREAWVEPLRDEQIDVIIED